MTLASLVTGRTALARETAIAALLDQDISTAIILEGLANGTSPLAVSAGNAVLRTARIAPGCMCCSGNLTMRVTLNRMLRHRPKRLFISLATDGHLDHIQEFLLQPPYDNLIELTETIEALPNPA